MNRASQILALGLLIALAIIAVTLFFARGTVEILQARDSSPARAAADSLQREVDRLTSRYEQHLREALAVYRSGSSLSAIAAAEELTGVVRFTDLRQNSTSNWPEIEPTPSAILRPRVRLEERDRGDVVFQLDADEIFTNRSQDSGWATGENSTAYFWDRTKHASAQVATIDLRAVQSAMNRWLGDAELSNLGLSPLLSNQNGGIDRIVDAKGEVIWTTAAKPVTPHRVFTISSQLGRWQLQSQDSVVTMVEWRLPLLVSGCALAAVVAVAALFFSTEFRRALALSEQRVSFVNSVSHELRTPITNILIQGDLAAEELGPEMAEPSRRLGLLREEAARLSRLVDNVLTFSRREQGKIQLHFESVDPDRSIQTVLDNFRPSLTRHGFEIATKFGVDTEIEVDPDALAQILTNLISNVEKYGRSGKWLGLNSLVDEGRMVIRCSDRGAGIPDSRYARIFEPFYRATDSLNEGVSGAGLGLTIARDLARRMGGDLTCLQPDSGETGAIFELTLPLQPRS